MISKQMSDFTHCDGGMAAVQLTEAAPCHFTKDGKSNYSVLSASCRLLQRPQQSTNIYTPPSQRRLSQLQLLPESPSP